MEEDPNQPFSYPKYQGLDLSGNPVWRTVEASPEMMANLRRTRAEEEEIARRQEQYAVPSRPEPFMTNERYLYSLDQYGRLMNRIYQGNLYGVPADVLERAYGRAYNPVIDVANRTTADYDRMIYNTLVRNQRMVDVMPELRRQTQSLPTELRANIASRVVPRLSSQEYDAIFYGEEGYDPRIDIRNPYPTRPNTPR